MNPTLTTNPTADRLVEHLRGALGRSRELYASHLLAMLNKQRAMVVEEVDYIIQHGSGENLIHNLIAQEDDSFIEESIAAFVIAFLIGESLGRNLLATPIVRANEFLASNLGRQQGQITAFYTDRTTARRIARGLTGISDPAQAVSIINNVFQGSSNRAGVIAGGQAVKGASEGLRQVYRENSINYMRWYVNLDGRECEWCPQFHDRIIQVSGESYARAGQTIVGDQGHNLNLITDIETPPLHPNCRCFLLPVV